MRRNHAQEDPIEGFDASELPPVGPQGIPGAEDRRLPLAPPRLCEVGPCVHYHRFQIQLDVESPKAAGIDPGGKMAGDGGGQPFHVRTHHYCYPDSGIETDLGSLPVMECNRWDPVPLVTIEKESEWRRRFFAEDPRGGKYREDFAAWNAARAELEHDDDDPVATWVTINLRDGDEIAVRYPDTAPPDLPLISMDADTARAFLTMQHLRERYGGQTVHLEIWRKSGIDGDALTVVDTLNVEVK